MDGEVSEQSVEIASDHEDARVYATPAPHHQRPPPAKANKGTRLLVVIVRVLVMSSALFFFFLFAGIAAVVVLHLLVAGTSLGRRRRRHGGSAAAREGIGQGLSREELKRLPASKFSEKGGLAPADCAVCLEKLREGDRSRELPRCGHSFHRACVDRWLARSPACPLCRTAVRHDSGQVRPLLLR